MRWLSGKLWRVHRSKEIKIEIWSLGNRHKPCSPSDLYLMVIIDFGGNFAIAMIASSFYRVIEGIMCRIESSCWSIGKYGPQYLKTNWYDKAQSRFQWWSVDVAEEREKCPSDAVIRSIEFDVAENVSVRKTRTQQAMNGFGNVIKFSFNLQPARRSTFPWKWNGIAKLRITDDHPFNMLIFLIFVFLQMLCFIRRGKS